MDTKDHERAREVYEQFNANPLSELWITTYHVVFESIRLARRCLHHRADVEMGERLYDESGSQLITACFLPILVKASIARSTCSLL